MNNLNNLIFINIWKYFIFPINAILHFFIYCLFQFIYKSSIINMMSLDFEDFEGDSFYGVNSHFSTSTVSSFNEQEKKRRGRHKTSFIWNHCQLIENGWECIVEKENGEPCGMKFLSEHTKGSTSNTLHHLQYEHNLLRPELSKKVFIYII
jgi:hypothetical protein